MIFKRFTIVTISDTAFAVSFLNSIINKLLTILFIIEIGVISTILKALLKINKLVQLPFNLSGLPINTLNISHD